MNADYQSKLPPSKNGGELLDLYYLDMRSALLETAAAFDRLQRADALNPIMDDQRIHLLRSACRLLAGEEAGRTERILQLFSQETL